MIALISMSKERQQVESNKQNNPIHRMNNEVLKNHTGDTLYVSYDSREYDDYIVDKIIKDMNRRGYRVVNKYTEYLQYQELIGELLETSCYVDDTIQVENAVGTPYQIAKVINKDGIVTLVLDDE